MGQWFQSRVDHSLREKKNKLRLYRNRYIQSMSNVWGSNMLDITREICTNKSGSWNEGKSVAEPFQ